MELSSTDVHIWSATLSATSQQEEDAYQLLSPDEHARADRFRFAQHRRRFIMARSNLRQILSFYLNIDPKNICFMYNDHGKPYLESKGQTNLEFSLAHSDDLAAYAIRLNHAIGIDIEIIKDPSPKGVAERFFSELENKQLSQLSESEYCQAFYRIWVCKEAVIKADGRGLSNLLASFDVKLTDTLQTILLGDQHWYLVPINIDPAFKAALASNQAFKQISYWYLSDQGYKLDSISQF